VGTDVEEIMTHAIAQGAGPMTNPSPDLSAGPGPRRPRVLVVDDHEIGRKSLARLLGVLGYEITEVKDGESAIAMMEQDHGFDYVLTDLRLPDLDGREVVQAAHRLLECPRIALITGWDVQPEETDRLGIDWVFLKPLDITDIVAKLRQCPPPDLAPDVD
jgi:CheY-like chemotaxis protein